MEVVTNNCYPDVFGQSLLWCVFLTCLYVPFLPFHSIGAQFLGWSLLNSPLSGASSSGKGSVGRGGRDGLGSLQLPFGPTFSNFPHLSGFLCCGSTARCSTLSGQGGPSQDSGGDVWVPCPQPRVSGEFPGLGYIPQTLSFLIHKSDM